MIGDPTYLARLPWRDAQDQLIVGRGPTTIARGSAGWHGPSYDNERVAFAVVNETGPFAAFAGGVVRFSYTHDPYPPRSAICFCHATGDPFEDVSLSRRAFLALAGLGVDEIEVVGELLEEKQVDV